MSEQDLVDGFAQAIKAHAPLPEVEQTFDLEKAYTLQHQVTALRSAQGVGGVKVGVTNPQMQAFFGLDHALLGSLYGDGRLGDGASIQNIEGRGLETEFAVLVDSEGQPKAIAPAIEIVFVNFSRKSDTTAPNLVVGNLGADLFLVGEFLPWDSPHSDVTATLTRDGEVVNEASMNEALGGPAAALPWVWNEMKLRGYPIQDETLIMMGSCGGVVPGEVGSYAADYGPMGKLQFLIE